MQQSQALIERVRRISASTQRIDLAVERGQRDLSAGQCLLARVTESSDPYLREPWVPVSREGTCLIIERPAMQPLSPGQIVNVIGPVGKPIPLRESAQKLLLIAHEAAPIALLMLAESALKKGCAVTLALTGAALHYPLDALPKEIEVIRGDSDMSSGWNNQASTLLWADQIVTVAPPPYDVTYYAELLALVRMGRVEVPDGFIYGLYQAPMPCGIGACLACVVRVGNAGRDEIPACLEGPAFDLLQTVREQ